MRPGPDARAIDARAGAFQPGCAVRWRAAGSSHGPESETSVKREAGESAAGALFPDRRVGTYREKMP